MFGMDNVQALEKLKRQLAEAEAALETRKKPPADTGPRVVGEGLVIDEWVSVLILYTRRVSWYSHVCYRPISFVLYDMKTILKACNKFF